MNKYTNLEKFEAWVKGTAKVYLDNIEDYLNDLEEQYMNNGTADYELSSYETKSGNPECYSYEVEDKFDGDEFVEREFIF